MKLIGVILNPVRKYNASRTINKFMKSGGELLNRRLPNGNTVRSISIPYKDGSKSYIQVLDKKNHVIYDRSKTITSRIFKQSSSGMPLWKWISGVRVMK